MSGGRTRRNRPIPRRKRAVVACSAQTDFAALLGAPAAPTKHGTTVAEIGSETPPSAPVWALRPLPGLVPIYGIKLVRTGSIALPERLQLRRPGDVVQLLQKHLAGADRELFVVVLLDVKNQVIRASTISVGDLNTALVHPREVFKPAILANASGVVLAHNHPSGDPTPSPEDLAVTKRLIEAGELLGIDVLDHIVLGDQNRFVSLSERGLCDFRSSTSSKLGQSGPGLLP